MFLVLLLALFSSSPLYPFSITLETQDRQTSIPAHKPFRIIAVVQGGDRNTGNVAISGLDQLQLLGQQRGNSINMINGSFSSTITYAFTVMATNPGTITVGPARVHHQGKEIASSPLTLTITPAQTTSTTRQTGGGMAVTLAANKDEVVVGEPVEVVLTLSTTQPVLEASVGKFEAPNCDQKEIKQMSHRVEVKNGVQCSLIEKRVVVIPHAEGAITLGPVVLEAAVAGQRRQQRQAGLFDDSFFDSFFGQRAEHVQLHSNPLTLKVLPLPTSQPVDAVGAFSSYAATVSNNEVEVNEPLTLTLTLKGRADLTQITIPKLTLPSSLKYYESKNETHENLERELGEGEKKFEFVLQASKPGSITIPAQTFRYFDTQSRRIVTIATTPLRLQVTGVAAPTIPTTPIQPTDTTSKAPELPAPNDYKPKQTTPASTSFPALPWWLFASFLLAPAAFFARPLLRFFSVHKQRLIARYKQRRSSRIQTLHALTKQADLPGVYAFFMTYLGQQVGIAPATLTLDTIEELLADRGIEREKIEDFIGFLASCSSAKYSQKTLSTSEKETLLKKAHYWFTILHTPARR